MDYVQLFKKELDGQRVSLVQRGISRPYLIVRIGQSYRAAIAWSEQCSLRKSTNPFFLDAINVKDQ
jgi:hypothetical protein